MTVFDLIAQQQKGREGTTVYMVGQQLADICRREPESAEIVLKDLEQEGMGIADAERKIKAFADEQHKKLKTDSVGVDPAKAEGIIREFYGLPGAGQSAPVETTPKPAKSGIIDLDDFF